MLANQNLLKTLVSKEAYCGLLMKGSCRQPLRLDHLISSKNSVPRLIASLK